MEQVVAGMQNLKAPIRYRLRNTKRKITSPARSRSACGRRISSAQPKPSASWSCSCVSSTARKPPQGIPTDERIGRGSRRANVLGTRFELVIDLLGDAQLDLVDVSGRVEPANPWRSTAPSRSAFFRSATIASPTPGYWTFTATAARCVTRSRRAGAVDLADRCCSNRRRIELDEHLVDRSVHVRPFRGRGRPTSAASDCSCDSASTQQNFGQPVVEVARHLAELHQCALHVSEDSSAACCAEQKLAMSVEFLTLHGHERLAGCRGGVGGADPGTHPGELAGTVARARAPTGAGLRPPSAAMCTPRGLRGRLIASWAERGLNEGNDARTSCPIIIIPKHVTPTCSSTALWAAFQFREHFMRQVEISTPRCETAYQVEGVSATVDDKLHRQQQRPARRALPRGRWPAPTRRTSSSSLVLRPNSALTTSTLVAFELDSHAVLRGKVTTMPRCALDRGEHVHGLPHRRQELRVPGGRGVATTLDEGAAMIANSVDYLTDSGKIVLVDSSTSSTATRPAITQFSLRAIEAAVVRTGAPPRPVRHQRRHVAERGASDRRDVKAHVGDGDAIIGIHCHDDTGCAVANSMAAVEAGSRSVQGTLNGLANTRNANLHDGHPEPAAEARLHLPSRRTIRRLTAVDRHVADAQSSVNPRRPTWCIGVRSQSGSARVSHRAGEGYVRTRQPRAGRQRHAVRGVRDGGSTRSR